MTVGVIVWTVGPEEWERMYEVCVVVGGGVAPPTQEMMSDVCM